MKKITSHISQLKILDFIERNTIIPPIYMIKAFAIFGVVNFVLFYLLWNHIFQEEYSDTPLRLIACTLCATLSFCDYWPKSFKKLLMPFWYVTICYCLPFFGTYMFLINHASVSWGSNIVIGLFWLVLITDWLSFILIFSIGVTLGIIYYKILHGDIYLGLANMIGLYSNHIWAVVMRLLGGVI